MQTPFNEMNTHAERMEQYRRAGRCINTALKWGTLALVLAFIATGKPYAAVKEAIHVYSLEGME